MGMHWPGGNPAFLAQRHQASNGFRRSISGLLMPVDLRRVCMCKPPSSSSRWERKRTRKGRTVRWSLLLGSLAVFIFRPSRRQLPYRKPPAALLFFDSFLLVLPIKFYWTNTNTCKFLVGYIEYLSISEWVQLWAEKHGGKPPATTPSKESENGAATTETNRWPRGIRTLDLGNRYPGQGFP